MDELAEMVDRINRYIMECKYLKHLYDLLVTLELIDTLWNVNRQRGTVSGILLGINRYIMECKFHN